MFPAQTIHRWGYGTRCWLFALESPRRLLCSGSVQKAPEDRGEESASGDNSRGWGRGGVSESKIKGWKKNLAQYDVSVNIVLVPRREDR